MVIKNIYKQQLDKLSELYGKTEAESILKILYESIFDKPLGILLVEKFDLSDKYIKTLENSFSKLLNFEPIQYILNKAYFFGYEFYVDENVLIPRNETEELVKLILDSEDKNVQLKILDIGTGSGCIPITLKLERNNYDVFSMDISENALKVARKNAENLNADVQFFCNNILNLEETHCSSSQKFDIIVSNPPYVLEKEKSQMIQNVLGYEPELALFVPDDDPLKYYKAIINTLPLLLKDTGRLYLEINNLYADDLSLLLKQYFEKVEIHKDFRGNRRFIVGVSQKISKKLEFKRHL
ncbi:peptide chain release factor N(5)-glutamine methyltransferase [Bacteroidales bacterium OttesenSCG-928-K03]|nr:peptide chain release factor N(5)-glutamine methyltransferase [Bacteroidales bacterium OttesenSCG-928-L14]MDL2240315.1 peptide chain release factor N(5)-glutamine methyltransferase [Bacteroidales bacterium OttesenSCG-928-K22]MDL2242879.1 peptide chain release factor N(5)-glutamine methyltransferase [Bacteroidales bacterium OttesenSCG-928-K03]